MSEATTADLKPALVLGWAVAAARAKRHPPVAPPGPLRPLLRFARLPDRALDTVRTVLEDDEGFRQEVAAAADEEPLGRVPWLWLVRPEGWEEEVDAILAASNEAAEAARSEKAQAERLATLEVVAARLEADLAVARADGATLEERLQQARGELRDKHDALGALQEDLGGAQRDLAAARDDLEEARAAAEQATADLEKARAELAAERDLREKAEADLAATRDALAARAAELGQAREQAGSSRARAAAIGAAIADAGQAATRLGDALRRAATLAVLPAEDVREPAGLIQPAAAPESSGGPVAGVANQPASGPTVSGPAAQAARPARASGGRRRPPGAGRQPAPLPPAVHDDSPEAAAHLVRLAGVVVLADGYNVTLQTWRELSLPDQRHHLVTALTELALRTGATVEVVFDGAEGVDPIAVAPAARGVVRVGFSPPGVDADEVIIDRVGQLPEATPVVVATDDRRLRSEVAKAGANLLSVAQLLAAAGRRPT